MNNFRTDNFKRNNELELLLDEINNDLFLTENNILATSVIKDDYPMIFIVGSFRSGTTLLLQWLSNLKIFSYPSNILSRFYKAPIIGAKIQKLLTDPTYNYKDEILDFNSDVTYYSENGKTKGALAPNEFWYFWRRFLNYPDKEIEYIPSDILEKTFDKKTFRKELLGIASVFNKPLAMKALIFNNNIPFLDSLFKRAIFIYIKRNPLTNISSALDARVKQNGSRDKWYSFKIPEYKELIKFDKPEYQVAGQVFYTNNTVKKGLCSIIDERKLTIQYEEFCQNPKIFYDLLINKLNQQGFILNNNYNGPVSFKISRSNEVNQDIKEAYSYFESNNEGD